MSLAKKVLQMPNNQEKRDTIRAFFPDDYKRMYGEDKTLLQIKKGDKVRLLGGVIEGIITKYSSNSDIQLTLTKEYLIDETSKMTIGSIMNGVKKEQIEKVI